MPVLAGWMASAWLAAGPVEAVDGGVLAPVQVRAAPLAPPPAARDVTAVVSQVDVRAQEGRVTEAGELLLSTPGVLVQDSGGAGQRKVVSVRGAGTQGVPVLLDGIPLAGPGQAFDLSRVPLAALERVEVLRGPGAARDGLGSLGGAVNLVSRKARGTQVFAELQGGSFLTGRLAAGGAFPLGAGQALAVLHGLTTDGRFGYRYDPLPVLEGNPLEERTRTNNEARQLGALLRFGQGGPDSRLDVVAEGLLESRGLPGPAQNPTSDARQESARGTLAVRGRRGLPGGGSLAGRAWLRLDGSSFQGLFGAGRWDQLEASALGEVELRQPVGDHGLWGLASLGVDLLRAPAGGNPGWGRAALLLGDEWTLLEGALLLDAAVRVDVAGSFVLASPKVGALWLLPLGLSLKANAGWTARAPSFVELYVPLGTLAPNPDLRPERALNLDVAVALERGPWFAQVAGFAVFWQDLITYELYPGSLARPFNVQAARGLGLEAEVVARPFEWLEAQASYSLLWAVNQEGDPRFQGKGLPYRPVHRVQGRVSAGPAWLSGRVELLAQSEQAQNRAGTLVLPGRAFLNLGLSSTPWKNPRVTFTAEVKNVLDVSSQDVDGYPLPPRAAFATVAFTWDQPR